ncbi:hypothetical protein LRR81_08645 [Metabacillus sp. GX 13764]|uniref:hypothetical protein n=1 Tax=Metabacillus kandeliae TaxID=2900151 RepID=UPI001E535244|nr:hypothetical protein [Metabacillus kandeliae]MCD7034301.1 hypothetical protein [Metabacillus kandeliae]
METFQSFFDACWRLLLNSLNGFGYGVSGIIAFFIIAIAFLFIWEFIKKVLLKSTKTGIMKRFARTLNNKPSLNRVFQISAVVGVYAFFILLMIWGR